MNDRISVTSKTYVRMQVKATKGDPTGDPLECGLSTSYETPPTTWASGLWETEAGRYFAKLLVGPGSTYGAVTAGRYWLWSRVTDNPELVAIPAENPLKFA